MMAEINLCDNRIMDDDCITINAIEWEGINRIPKTLTISSNQAEDLIFKLHELRKTEEEKFNRTGKDEC